MGSRGKHTKLGFHILDDNIKQRTDNFKNNRERLILSKMYFKSIPFHYLFYYLGSAIVI